MFDNILRKEFMKKIMTRIIGAVKTQEFLGALSIALAVGIAVYALVDLDVTVGRGPILSKLFGTAEERQERLAQKQLALLEAAVLPQGGAVLPVIWSDLGRQLAESGVIDAGKFEKLYESRGGLNEEDKKLLYGAGNGNLRITEQNSGLLLNLLWALGLGNKNEILEKGPMMDKSFGGADRFASTGGWSLAEGNIMQHYSMHRFLNLTPEQQELVQRVSLNIFRPCCNNPTYFPDCNHGMAMLGFLELMASQGVGEEEMYKSALAVNAFWFPDNYLTIAKYLESKGLNWGKTEPKALLGANFSSASGYKQILTQVSPPTQQSGGSCGI
ncbi:MAG: hypothetical protein HYT65_03365 [Candidatus Yanofskybacteria bacterium]|nr:hypothetical protein [Candidatus Yanofskybacteria bacterium]